MPGTYYTDYMDLPEQDNIPDASPEEPLVESDEFDDDSQGSFGKAALFFLEVVKIVVLACVTIALVRYFLFKPFYVRGQSMEPTFYEHEYLIVDELTYRFRQPERGEVVVFKAPSEPGEYYLKRVIGLPGEQVKVENNKVIIYNQEHPQGLVIQEAYLEKQTEGSVRLTLNDNEYFVLGDNRPESFDSRRFGAITRNDIVGRAVFRGWPLPRLGTFTTPNYEPQQ